MRVRRAVASDLECPRGSRQDPATSERGARRTGLRVVACFAAVVALASLSRAPAELRIC